MSPLRVRRPLVPLVAVLAVVAALGLAIVLREVVDPGGEDNANGSVAVRDVTDLRGTWTAVNDVGAPSPVVEGSSVALTFEGTSLRATTGCNTLTGTVRVVDSSLVQEMSAIADRVYVDRALVGYVRRLAEASREVEHVRLGLSPRGCLALIRVAKTWAAADGRTHVVPQDVASLAEPVLCHRLILDAEAAFRGVGVDDVITRLLASVPAPQDRA